MILSFFPAPTLCGTIVMLYICLSCVWGEKGNKIEPKKCKTVLNPV